MKKYILLISSIFIIDIIFQLYAKTESVWWQVVHNLADFGFKFSIIVMLYFQNKINIYRKILLCFGLYFLIININELIKLLYNFEVYKKLKYLEEPCYFWAFYGVVILIIYLINEKNNR